MAKGERVITASRYVAMLVAARHGVEPSRIRVIPRGVDPALFNPARVTGPQIAGLATAWRVPDGVPVVMLPARLTRWKGAAVLIDAVARLARTDVCCVLVGAAQGREHFAKQLEIKARALGLAVACAWSAIATTCRPLSPWRTWWSAPRSNPRASAAPSSRRRRWDAR